MKLAIIPARGGSKRIPRKNLKLFAGRPIIAYSIEAALNSEAFDRVVVSTEDREIADLAIQLGAEVPFLRPRQLADDYTVIADVIRHAIEWFEANQSSQISLACCIYATAPMIQVETIRKGVSALLHGQADYALSICTFPFPIQRALRMATNGSISMINPENALTRSQDLEECYHDAAQFFGGTAEAFLGRVDNPVTRGVPVPRYTVQDIDTEEDWLTAEAMFRAMSFRKGEVSDG